MQKVKKPFFYKKLEKAIEEEYIHSDLKIVQFFYLGSMKPIFDSNKYYNFLVLGKDENNKLAMWLEQLSYRDGYVSIMNSIEVGSNTLDSIKELNLDTIKVLYGGV